MQQARSVDIFPTLLQLAGINVPESTQGRSLLHLIFGSSKLDPPPSYAETYYPQYHFGWSRLLSLRNSSYKYIDAPKPELYDLKKDPKELQNIFSEHKDLAAKMKQQLISIADKKQHDAVMEPGAMDDETHEKLAALGYIGAFGGPVDQDPMKLPDPKDKIDLFDLITEARQDSLAGDSDKSISKFQQVLKMDPNIVDAHFMLGNEYFRKEEYAEAIEEFKKTLQLKPDYTFAMINLANSYRQKGDMDAALLGFEHFLETNPDNTQVLFHIGEIYLTRKNPDKALEYLNRALKTDPETSWVACSIGTAYMQKNDDAKAEEYFKKSLELNPKINMAHFNLAQLYESRGKSSLAEKEYLAEIEVAPKNYKAHFNLGRLYINAGNLNDGIEQLKAAVELAPEFPLGYLFLAQAYVENGSDLDHAIDLAKKGILLNPDPEYKPLGHLILADIYNRLGRYDLEKQELKSARAVM
jgi:tetratricopeptide (TPR) repeat protein